MGFDPTGFHASEIEQRIDPLEQPQCIPMDQAYSLAVGAAERRLRTHVLDRPQ